MVKWKRAKRQTKNLKEHNQPNIERQEPHLKPEVNPGAPEG